LPKCLSIEQGSILKKEFIEKYGNKKKRSYLLPYLKDIETLLDHEATQNSIIEYLKDEKNLVVTQSNLSRFIKRYIVKDPLSKKSKKAITKKEETPPAKETSKKKEDSIFL